MLRVKLLNILILLFAFPHQFANNGAQKVTLILYRITLYYRGMFFVILLDLFILHFSANKSLLITSFWIIHHLLS